MNTKSLWQRKYFAEFLGTFFFLFGGFSAIEAVNLGYATNGDLVVPLAFGFSLMVTIFALGHISGGHFNPAVTIGLAFGKHFDWKRVPYYLIAQVLGATLASALLFFLVGQENGFMAPTNGLGTFDVLTVGIAELLGAFLLVFVIASIATDDRTKGIPNGLAIGGTLFSLALTRGWLGGGSFNPARTLGPAIIHGQWNDIMIYMIAPIAGGVLAVMTYNYLRAEK